MSIGHVLTPSAFHQCAEVYDGKKAILDGFVSYNLQGVEVIGLAAETAQTRRRMRYNDDFQNVVTIPALPVYFRAGLVPVALESVRYDYDKYRGCANNPDKAMGEGGVEEVDMGAFGRHSISSSQAGDAGGVMKEVLIAITVLV